MNLITLAIPIFLEFVFNHLIGTVSTVILSGYSDEAVVATGSVNIVFSLCILFFTGISTGASVVISNLIGAEKVEDAKKAASTGVLAVGALGILFSATLIGIGPLIATAMNLTGTVFELAVVYMRIRAVSLLFTSASNVLLAILRCYGFPRYSVMIGMVKNVCNAFFSYLAVYVMKKPMLSGVRGVALGHILSEIICLTIVTVLFSRLRIGLRRPETMQSFFSLTKRIFAIGIPTCISSTMFTMTQIVTNSFAQLLGLEAAAAKIYCANILSYAYLFSSSVGHANALLAGRLYGAKRYEHADRLNKMLVHFTIPVNLLISLCILLLRKPLLSMFTDSEEIFFIALGVFVVDIFVEQARAISHVYEYSLRSTKYVWPTMIVTLISAWALSVGAAYVLSLPLSLGLIGFYIGLALDEWVRASFTFFRWKWRIRTLQSEAETIQNA